MALVPARRAEAGSEVSVLLPRITIMMALLVTTPASVCAQRAHQEIKVLGGGESWARMRHVAENGTRISC
jgi:hypothetical protein